jgi:hypothetical protein
LRASDIEVELVERAIAVLDGPAWQDLEAGDQLRGPARRAFRRHLRRRRALRAQELRLASIAYVLPTPGEAPKNTFTVALARRP